MPGGCACSLHWLSARVRGRPERRKGSASAVGELACGGVGLSSPPPTASGRGAGVARHGLPGTLSCWSRGKGACRSGNQRRQRSPSSAPLPPALTRGGCADPSPHSALERAQGRGWWMGARARRRERRGHIVLARQCPLLTAVNSVPLAFLPLPSLLYIHCTTGSASGGCQTIYYKYLHSQ